MLAFLENGLWVEWVGQMLKRLGSSEPVQIPRQAEAAWPDDDLALFGLRRVLLAEPRPEMTMVSYVIADAGGSPVQVGTFVPVPPPPVPTSISPLQARKALRAVGLKAPVDAYVDALSEEEQEEWEYCTEVRRDNAIIAAGAAALGWTSEQLDDLFRLGATL